MIGKVKIYNVLDEAIQISNEAHAGQFRKYADPPIPYVTHLERVAERVSRLERATPEMIAAARLHDVFEDCDPKWRDEVAKRCGAEVFAFVHQLTNPSMGLKVPRERRKAIDRELLRHASIEARMIKMVDRTDNLNDMHGADSDFKQLYIEESVELLSVLNSGIAPGSYVDRTVLLKEYESALQGLKNTV